MWHVFHTDFTDVTKKLEGGLTEEVKAQELLNRQIHRMCLLRVKLMHFVNSLHNYIMTRVRGADLFTPHPSYELKTFSKHHIVGALISSLIIHLPYQILHSTGLEFQHQVQDAKDLDQLIKIHYRYLATIHDRCLLREKVSGIQMEPNNDVTVEVEARETKGTINNRTPSSG